MKKFKGLTVFILCAVMIFSSVACANFGANNDAEAHQHKVIKRSGVEATCIADGKLTYYECVNCKKLFADKACTTEIKASDIPLGKTSHQLTHVPEVEATENKNGNIEYWSCGICGKYFADSFAKNEISKEMIVTVNGLDFVVTVESGREPVILQLADPQIIDSSTKRADNKDLSDKAIAYWGPDSRDELAYDLMTEVIEASNPDLILVSGDNVYGKYDDDGHLHEEFVKFMESFNIPWAPIMGNHDIETAKGADWICDLYENAPNCLFKQNTLSGHGNYTVGIQQDGEIKRVIFNMDTNGCTGASQKSLDNPQTISYTNNTYGVRFGAYGLQKDQITWFEKAADDIKEKSPNAKLSLHIHVPMNKVYTAINDAYKEKVGVDYVARVYSGFNSIKYEGRYIAPERVKGHTEGDFGMTYTLYSNTFIECWDTETTNGVGNQDQTYNRIKAKGVDSILLGHMHGNSTSIVYDGIRFQFGQKCTLYDSIQKINTSTGVMGYSNGAYALIANEIPLIGGTVMKLDKNTGAISDAYIEYNTGYGKEINWSQYYNTIG